MTQSAEPATPTRSDLLAAWKQVEPKLLFPPSRLHPYYICAPKWVYTSAGVRALYLLCHALNRSGYLAYIVHTPFKDHFEPPWTTHELNAPMLDQWRAVEHFKAGLCPIVVYPEVVSGNPLEAPAVARWVLNFPGLLGGNAIFDEGEMCFGYSKELARAANAEGHVLHLPAIDTRIFHPPVHSSKRKGTCFYAEKYQKAFHGKLMPITRKSFQITRDQKNSLSPCELADLLRRSELLYTYENTAVAIEAVLCGCPTVFLPNSHLEKIIGREELGKEGYAWGTESTEINRAKESVVAGAINYFKTYDIFWEQLAQFIRITQSRASKTNYSKMMKLSFCDNNPKPQGMTLQIMKIQKELSRWKRKTLRLLGVKSKHPKRIAR